MASHYIRQLVEALRTASQGGARELPSPPEDDRELVELSSLVQGLVGQAGKERELRHEQTVLRYIIAHVPHSIFWKDLDGRYLGGNQNMLRDCGVERLEDLVGKTDHDFFSQAEADFFVRCDREVMQNGNALLDIEEPQTRKDGKEAVLLTSKVPLRDEEGHVSGLLGIYADITERKRVERELEKAKNAAEAADHAKGDFLANISHELRTPLTLILGPLDSLLADATVDGRVRADLTRVRRNAARLHRLVNDVLDFTKIEAGAMRPEWESVDAVELVSLLVEDAQALAERRGLRLTPHVEVDGDALLTPLDRRMAEKIVLNLVGNALKFTPAGGTVDVWLRAPAGSQWWELIVSDSGIGIPRDKQGLLFQRFQQIDSSSTRKHEGTGIGLALVKEFAELLGGSVDVESAPGVGSRFRVRLPRSADEARGPSARSTTPRRDGFAHEHIAPVVEASSASTRFNGAGTILVADDNPDMCAYVQEVLSADGWRVDCVSDGNLALEAARARPPAVIVSDIMMPGMDGLELVARLKSDERLRRVPVIVLTARAGREAVVTGLESGADDYLPKPFAPDELRARVRAAWRTVELHRELEARQHELVQSGKMAAVGTLVAGLSHELNNPLAIIHGFAQGLLRQGGLDERIADAVRAIERQSSRCAQLVRTLLDFARKRPSARERKSLRALVDRVAEITRGQAKQRGIVLELAHDEALPELDLSPVEIESALLNLVNNALDATPAGGRVVVEVRAAERDGRRGVSVAVRDSGCGMPPDVMAQIFDPFFTTKPVGQGTGLGLSLTRRIVESHGGVITVESAPARGTSMLLWLPLP